MQNNLSETPKKKENRHDWQKEKSFEKHQDIEKAYQAISKINAQKWDHWTLQKFAEKSGQNCKKTQVHVKHSRIGTAQKGGYANK